MGKFLDKITDPELFAIKSNFHYYSKEYIQENKEYGWRRVPIYLKDSVLLNHINNISTEDIGVINSHETNFIAFDIDDHHNERIHSLTILKELEQFLNVDLLASKSPRGFHGYLCFNDYCSVDIIKHGLEQRLESFKHKKRIEIKPTSDVGLRLFTYKSLYNTKTDTFYSKEYSCLSDILFNEIHKYNVSEIINIEFVASTFKRAVYSTTDMFTNGESNLYFIQHVPIMITKGLSNSEIIAELRKVALPNYKGKLFSNLKLLNSRIESSRRHCLLHKYDKDYETKSIIESAMILVEEKYKIEINKILSLYDVEISHLANYNANLARAACKRIVLAILSAMEINKTIFEKDKKTLANRKSRFPFYYHEVSRERYPISQSFLKLFVSRPSPLLKFLRSVGFIGAGFSYSPRSCKYYSINLLNFKEIKSLILLKDYINSLKSKLVSLFHVGLPKRSNNIVYCSVDLLLNNIPFSLVCDTT